MSEEELSTVDYERKPGMETTGTETETEEEEICADVCKTFCKLCKFVVRIYRDKFKREIIKATGLFLLALKLSNECHGIIFPLREYVPFEKK